MAVATRLAPVESKPAAVGMATFLIYLSLAVGVLKVVFDWGHLKASGRSANPIISVGAFTIVVIGLLAWKMGQGRNWARITFLILFIVGAVPAMAILKSNLDRSVVVGVLAVIQTIAQLYALWLVFTPPGSHWFKTRRV
jgi:hypothetical protein